MNDEKYILSIDNGSQSSKVSIFDLKGNLICQASKKLSPMFIADGGIAEHPKDDLWDSIKIACQRVFDKFQGNKQNIIGVGLCTIRCCVAHLKEDGSLANPVLSWMDLRVSKPYNHVNPDVKYITTSSGYITKKMTGNFTDTAGNYQGVWPIDTDTWKWSENQQSFIDCNIKKEMLFDLKMPGEILGYINDFTANETGIPKGLPVIATSNDKAVETLGSGFYDDDVILVSLGTYICSMIQGKENQKNPIGFWTNFANIPNRYLYESSGIRRGMWMVSWFCKILGKPFKKFAKKQNSIIEQVLNEEAKDINPGSDGLLTVLDWLSPTDKTYRKGCITGFDGRHTRAHIYRSILEGIAMTMKNNIDDMCQELNIVPTKLVITGGGSYSDIFMQIFSDVFGIKVVTNKIKDAVSLGAAINVAVTLGIYKDYESASNIMIKTDKSFNPNLENTELYNILNKNVYRNIKIHLDEIHKNLENITKSKSEMYLNFQD